MSPDSSPLVIPMGPLAAAAFESGMSAVEELKLLKAQVRMSLVFAMLLREAISVKKLRSPFRVVMVQLKDVINTMVYSFIFSFHFHPENKISKVDKLGQFAKEVTRVSQEVGTEG